MLEEVSKVDRPETFSTVAKTFESVERPIGGWEKFWNNSSARKVVLLIVLASTWELFARSYGNEDLLPTFLRTATALVASFRPPFELPWAAWETVKVLLKGYGAGLLLAAALTAFASVSRVGADLLETLTSMFHPLPSIALLPIALILYGVDERALIFVLVNAVVWSVALNTHAGFRSISPTWGMVGRNYGLSAIGYILRILIPGAFPSILTGIKTGWAFAWRTVIAAELVFSASGGSGGIGRYIKTRSDVLRTEDAFAGLLTVIIFGLIVEHLVFRTIENRTVRRWGMQA
jgi:NitT/TauT family transport system permease protein